MFSITKIKTAFLFLTGLLFSISAHAETITISTYYPSPYGVYDELRSNRMAIGRNYVNDPTTYPVADDNLIVEGKVGINTTDVTNAQLVISNSISFGGEASGSYNANFGNTSSVVDFAFSGILSGVGNEIHTTRSAIGGGNSNEISASYSFIGGGNNNEVSGSGYSSVVGGSNNIATGQCAFIGGGQRNTASGSRAAILNGNDNTASGSYSVVMGRNGTASHSYSFLWSGDGSTHSSLGNNTFNVFATDSFFRGDLGVSDNTTFLPSRPLHVRTRNAQTAVLIEGDNQNPNIAFSRNVDGNNKGMRIEYNRVSNNSTTTVGELRIQNSNGTGNHAGIPTVASFNANGNVGIGIENPSYQMQIVTDDDNTSSFTPTLLLQNDKTGISSGGNGLDWGVGIGFRLHTDNALKTAEIRGVNGPNNYEWGNSVDLAFWTGGSNSTKHAERMRIAADTGYVGIGTTSPGRRLDVNGDLNVAGTVIDSDGNLILRNDRDITGTDRIVGYNDLRLWGDGGTGTPHVYIDGIGRVGIGRTPASGSTLDVNGNIARNGGLIHSDQRLKKDIDKIEKSLDKIVRINGVSFKWRVDEFPERNFDSGIKYGVIAQNIEKIIPDLVITNDDGFKSVDYEGLIPVLIEAVKEQQIQIDELKKEIKKLKK